MKSSIKIKKMLASNGNETYLKGEREKSILSYPKIHILLTKFLPFRFTNTL